jgi:hypothetical protein
VDQERFVRLRDKEMLAERQFARLMSGPGVAPTAKNNPSVMFFQHPRRKLVKSVTYLPGGPDLVRIDGVDAVNVWMPSPAAVANHGRQVVDVDVAPWLQHMEHLVPDPRVRGLFLDWMAYVVQYPEEKPNWALFLGGTQGIGKDFAFLPLIHGIGRRNTRTVQPGELASEYTDWIAHKRLVVVEEMRNFETKTVMNKLKMYITRPPESVPVRVMYTPVYEVPNVACFVFMSNFRDALSLEKGDRRYLVYWSPAVPQPEAYFVSLAAWLASGGTDDVVAWLLLRDVRMFNAKGRAPDTDDKTAMEEAGRSDFEQAVVEAIQAGGQPFDADIATLQVLWAALPADIKRLPGAGLKKLGQAITLAGGGALRGPDGNARKVRLDPRGGPARFGRPRIWAVRDADKHADTAEADLRRAFLSAWVADVRPDELTDDNPPDGSPPGTGSDPFGALDAMLEAAE